MKKHLFALSLVALSIPAIAQDQQTIHPTAAIEQQQPDEQPQAGDEVAQEQATVTQDEQVASSGSYGQEEIAVQGEEVSTELAGTEEAASAARGNLSRGVKIGAGIAAGALVYALVSNNDDGNGGGAKSPGPTGTK